MKNLVMGAAKGYAWQELEPFVTSCKKFCPDADLVLFVDDISDFTRDKLIRGGATIKPIPATFQDIFIIHTRWKMYADYLAAHDENYAQVFITDTRDVIFQSYMFAPFNGCTNWLGYATEADNIRGDRTGDKTNYNWIADAFGRAEADKISDKKIICAGTIIGSACEMKIFCRVMWDTLKDNNVWGHEQAVVNYFVWNNLLPIEHMLEFDVQSGTILTNGLIENNHTRGDKILRGDGGIPAVVHQYDRHSELVELVDKVYRDKNFSFDARFVDTRSTVEQVACLLHADKIVEAAQIFLRKFLSPADFGESLNALISVLNIATRKKFAKPVEIIELAVQNVLSAEKLSIEQVFAVFRALKCAKENHHAVDPLLKENIVARILKFAEDYLDKGVPKSCLIILEKIEEFEVPADKNFYLLRAKANGLLRTQ